MADRSVSLAGLECDGEVLLHSGARNRERCIRHSLRGPIANDLSRPRLVVAPCGDCHFHQLSVGFPSGAGLPRNSADGARATLGLSAGYSRQQLTLHARSLALLPLRGSRARAGITGVYRDFSDRVVFWSVV